MAQSIKPVGYKLLVLPLEEKNYVTKGNIELVDNQLMCGKVIEVGEETKDIYSIGDVVIFPKNSGEYSDFPLDQCLINAILLPR